MCGMVGDGGKRTGVKAQDFELNDAAAAADATEIARISARSAGKVTKTKVQVFSKFPLWVFYHVDNDEKISGFLRLRGILLLSAKENSYSLY